MMGQGKSGYWVGGICAAVVLVSIGYGMGRRAAIRSLGAVGGVTPAGAPLPTIQIEPIQPQEELAAISAAQEGPVGSELAATGSPLPGPSPQEALTGSAPAAGGGSEEDPARVRQVQTALKAAGFDPGSADGKMGPRTRAAVRDFQLAHGLKADGKVGPRTWARMETFLNKGSQE